MPFCPECGKAVAPNAKFCRNCGASQLEDTTTTPVPAPAQVTTPVPEPMPAPAPVIITREPPQPSPVPLPPERVEPPVAPLLCSSCGSPLSPSEKFCGICGTRAGQTVPPAPQVPPAPLVPAAPAMGQTPNVRTCTACGNVIKPGDKYCSKCLVIVRDSPPQAAARTATPAPAGFPVPSPAPVMEPPFGARSCNTCGNIIKPGDKYCSKCLAIVRDNPPPAAAPVRPPVQPAAPAAPGSYVCASCGSPIAGTEKFCGICGAPVVAARVPAPAQSQPVQKTCSVCGAPISDSIKFCGGCGAPVGASFRAATVAQPAPDAGAAPAMPPSGEQIIGVIGNARKMKMLGASWDTYALVITDRRMIIAQLTADMLNAAYKEAAEKARTEGKGFLGQMAHQMAVAFQYCQKYETMPPDSALAETKGNRAIDNMRISAIEMNDKATRKGSMDYHEFIMTVQSADGKFEFYIGEDDRFITILKTAYQNRVHMPVGYFSTGAVRIKLF